MSISTKKVFHAVRSYNASIRATQEITSVSTETATCSGFSLDAYDRYVLGLLAKDDRAAIDHQIEQQCPVCINGVQRSLNLWLVFASSLPQTEPSADFRARLVRIAELSSRVLTVPKRQKGVHEPAILMSSLVVICLIVVTVLIFTWIAGRQSAHLDEQRANAELQRLTQELSNEEVMESQQKQRLEALTEKQKPATPVTEKLRTDLEAKLSKAQAEAEQFREHIEADRQRDDATRALLSALATPGGKLFTFRNAEGSPAAANAFVTETSQVIFVASNLPAPSAEHQYHLWIVRKDQALPVSAAVFSVSANDPVVVNYSEDKEAVMNLGGLFVTEEPLDGNAEPSGKRVLETSLPAAVQSTMPEI